LFRFDDSGVGPLHDDDTLSFHAALLAPADRTGRPETPVSTRARPDFTPTGCEKLKNPKNPLSSKTPSHVTSSTSSRALRVAFPALAAI
jgi:hypothetical protein